MIRNLWPLLIGFMIWAIAFALLYALQALGCVLSWSQFSHQALMVTILCATILVLALLLHHQFSLRKSDTGAISTIGAALTLAALVATAITFSPILFVAVCT